MRYYSHKRYQSEAIEGVTHIKVRTYKWTLDKEGLLPKLKPGFENYDLYFNKKGLLLYSYHYSRQGASELNKFAYFKDRLINIQTVYFPSYEMKNVSSFHYDEQGRLIKEIISNGRNDPDEEPEVISYIYEKNLITEIYVEPYDEIEHKIETYLDDEGNELEYRVYHDGEIDYCEKVTPESKVSLNTIFIGSHEIHYDYTYDAKGNWITKTVFENGEPREIIERVLGYG